MSLTKSDITFLDSLDDEKFLATLWICFGERLPQWKRCSKREYEKHCGENVIERLFSYRKVPYWNNGGGILDQISGKEPDGYYYEKCIGYQNTLMLGSDMMEYFKTRECMKPYFKELI